MILMSYDGSADAQAAMDRTAELMSGAELTVLTVWEPFIDVVARMGAGSMGTVMSSSGDLDIDAATQKAALKCATEGAERATAAGMNARPRTVSGHGGTARGILGVAAELDAGLIVLGTRGLSGVRSFLLGGVSHAVVQHADRPVLVVPSAAVAEERRGWAQRIAADVSVGAA